MSSLGKLLIYFTAHKRYIILAIAGIFLSTLSMSFIPIQTQRMIDVGIGNEDLSFVMRNALLMVFFGFIVMVGMFVNGIYGVRVAQNITADIRTALYHHIQTLSFGNLDKLNTGNLLVRLTTDITRIQQLVMSGLGILLMAPLLFLWSIVMIYFTSPELALIFWVILPIVVGLMAFFATRSQPMYKAVQQRLSRLNVVLQENLIGMRTVKAFVRSDFERDRFADANYQFTTENITVNQFVAWVMPTLQVVVNMGLVAVLWFGGNLAIDGAFTPGQIVAFINYLIQALTPMMFLGQILPQVAAAEASAARIVEVLESNAEVQDKPLSRSALLSQRTQMPQDTQEDSSPLQESHGRVVFDNVTFRYGKEDSATSSEDGGKESRHEDGKDVLSAINLIVEPGETVAILGATGSGKSSLVNLIPRFYDVDNGRILIDGVDIRDMTQASLRAQIGICLQEAILFGDKISENIRYGAPDLSDEQMGVVARAADAHEFILTKPKGYDAIIGQRGVNLSGGQRQRMSIARALARKPKILILDDSTSAVDVATERRIQRALTDLVRDCTTFIVAQRISTVLTADKIIVLDSGRIVAEGTHTELMKSSQHYREIYESQLGES